MSEVIVRMEMPESCDMCPCLDDYGDYPRCRISGEQRGYNFSIREKRMPNCPIICQLPEGHGRLVDTDNVGLAMVRKGQRSSRYKLGEMWELNGLEIQEALQTVSTIVPAERSET
jgi:hypothetical protein